LTLGLVHASHAGRTARNGNANDRRRLAHKPVINVGEELRDVGELCPTCASYTTPANATATQATAYPAPSNSTAESASAQSSNASADSASSAQIAAKSAAQRRAAGVGD
jgi:hypothetical protein